MSRLNAQCGWGVNTCFHYNKDYVARLYIFESFYGPFNVFPLRKAAPPLMPSRGRATLQGLKTKHVHNVKEEGKKKHSENEFLVIMDWWEDN